MKNPKRLFFGLVVTTVWLLALGAFAFFKRLEFGLMPPNAWGDFFAGMFAPLALLWLVLGYMEQRALLEATREQVENEKILIEMEKKNREVSAAPILRVKTERVISSEFKEKSFQITVSNIGPIALDVKCTACLDDNLHSMVSECSYVDKNNHSFSYSFPISSLSKKVFLKIDYRDTEGVFIRQIFSSANKEKLDLKPYFSHRRKSAFG